MVLLYTNVQKTCYEGRETLLHTDNHFLIHFTPLILLSFLPVLLGDQIIVMENKMDV